MINMSVQGLSQLDMKLKAIADEYGPKAAASPVRKALRNGGKKLQASAQQKVHVDTGTLKENIITTVERRPQEGRIEMRVTVRAKAQGFKSTSRKVRKGLIGQLYQHYAPLWYARFLEFGTSRMPAYPFLRPAWDELKASLPESIRDELALAIDATVRKLGK